MARLCLKAIFPKREKWPNYEQQINGLLLFCHMQFII